MSKSRSGGNGSPNLRLLRVGENVRHAIAAILTRGEVRDPALENVSVTVSEVRVSGDLRNATIFVMPLGGDEDEAVTKALNKHSAFIRGQMSKVLNMKFMPELKFRLDKSYDEASRIESILRDPRVQKDIRSPSETVEDNEE